LPGTLSAATIYAHKEVPVEMGKGNHLRAAGKLQEAIAAFSRVYPFDHTYSENVYECRQTYALMYYRIQASEGMPQRYGSQVQMKEQAKAYDLFPPEDENKVDEWRTEAGMARWPVTYCNGR
jgi:hypothetical protein